MTEVSSTRLYLGNLPRNVTKQDIEEHFSTHGSGKITEIKLMNGFGFIEYEDAMDARDVVPAFHGSDFKGERLTVQFARGPRRKENNFPGPQDRPTAPRPRRTMFRMQISGLPETSWQDLKDFARKSGLDVVYSETGREQGRGFVEFETANDLKTAVEKLDQTDFKGVHVSCTADVRTQPSLLPSPGLSGKGPSLMTLPLYRFKATLMTAPCVIRTGLAPPVGPTLLWMNTTEGSLHPVDTAPGITIGNARPSPCAGTTTTEMAMDAALPHGLGWRTTRLHVVPTTILMMLGLHLPHATMRIRILQHGPMAVLARPLAAIMLRMNVLAIGKEDWSQWFASFVFPAVPCR